MSETLSEQVKYTKVQSMVWILIAYITCIGAAVIYLYMPSLSWIRTDVILIDTLIADVIATVIIFMFSRAFKNSSFYDAYWSVIPPLIFHYWLSESSLYWQNPAVIAVGIVIWFWAIRLTWNWAKHWPGLHHEDWRYPLLKEKFPQLALVIDFAAIHLFPTLQVFLGLLPVYALLFLMPEEVIWSLVGLAFVLGILAPSIQLIADRQLHAFLAQRKPGEIIHHGLWRYSRHPNYFGELLFWCSLSVFGLAVLASAWWWLILGSVAMFLMFVLASIPMMEERSLERRPDYQRIIDTTSMLFPLPPKR